MVEPRKPKELNKFGKKGLAEDLAEYDRLLSERFSKDPSVTQLQGERNQDSDREKRVNVLGRRLFGAPKSKRKK